MLKTEVSNQKAEINNLQFQIATNIQDVGIYVDAAKSNLNNYAENLKVSLSEKAIDYINRYGIDNLQFTCNNGKDWN